MTYEFELQKTPHLAHELNLLRLNPDLFVKEKGDLMSQMKNLTVKSLVMTFVIAAVAVSSFSCAKKASGVRASVKKTQNLNMNPQVSNQAEQQAASQSTLYKIATITTPTETAAGHSAMFELFTPANMYVPITTYHENGNLDAEGIYKDASRGNDIYVQTRCSADGCSKYLVLLTVVRNNTALFQTAAVSYASDCKFYSVSVTNSFRDLNAFENYVQTTTYANPRNDCASAEAFE